MAPVRMSGRKWTLGSVRRVEREAGVLFGIPAFFTPGICHLKSKNKFAAHPFGADYVNGLIVGQNNFFCDGKTQPCALFILAPGGICFIEPVKDLPRCV